MRIRNRFNYGSTKLSCRLFGHVITGYQGDIPYLRLAPDWASIDGMGVHHIPIYGRCDKCGEDIRVGLCWPHSHNKGYEI